MYKTFKNVAARARAAASDHELFTLRDRWPAHVHVCLRRRRCGFRAGSSFGCAAGAAALLTGMLRCLVVSEAISL